MVEGFDSVLLLLRSGRHGRVLPKAKREQMSGGEPGFSLAQLHFLFLEETVWMRLLQGRKSLKMHLKQNQRRSGACRRELDTGTFLNPLTYLFGRVGGEQGRAKRV